MGPVNKVAGSEVEAGMSKIVVYLIPVFRLFVPTPPLAPKIEPFLELSSTTTAWSRQTDWAVFARFFSPGHPLCRVPGSGPHARIRFLRGYLRRDTTNGAVDIPCLALPRDRKRDDCAARRQRLGVTHVVRGQAETARLAWFVIQVPTTSLRHQQPTDVTASDERSQEEGTPVSESQRHRSQQQGSGQGSGRACRHMA